MLESETFRHRILKSLLKERFSQIEMNSKNMSSNGSLFKAITGTHKQLFFMKIIDRYLDFQPPSKSGEMQFNFPRLDVLASKLTLSPTIYENCLLKIEKKRNKYGRKKPISILITKEEFLLKVEIKTERLYMRSYKETDFEDCVSLYSDEKLVKYFDHGKPRSRQDVASLIEERADKTFKNGKPFGLFSIFQNTDMALLATGSLSSFQNLVFLNWVVFFIDAITIKVFVQKQYVLLYLPMLMN